MLSWLSLDCSTVSAAAYTWDPAGSTSSFGGGGTWDPTFSNWWTGTTTAAWSSGNDAWFTGPNAGGTITLDAPETVGNIVFSTNGYILSGSTLTVSPANLTSGTITSNQNATINSSIADNGGGVTFTGSHAVTLGAAFDTGLTGAVTVSSGTLLVNGTNPAAPNSAAGLYNASSITINSGASVVANTNNSLFGYPTQGHTIFVNQGGLLASPSNNTTHLNAVQMDGGTLSAASPNTQFGSWALDGGVSTPGNGDNRTSYILGGNLCLTQNSAGGTQFSVGGGDTLYVSAQLAFCTSFTNGTTQFSLANAGAGTLVLAASNNFSTSTLMDNGTLLLADPAALSASPLVMTAGTVGFSGITQTVPLVSLAGFGGTLLLANTSGSPVNVSVGSGGAVTNYSGLLTGSGSFTVTGGDLTLGGGNNYTGPTILAGGVLTLGNPAALGNGTIQFSGGTLQYSAAANSVDYSASFGTVSGQNAWNIDTNGQSPTFSGNLKGGTSVLTKLGLGELTLAGTNTYSGGTIIKGGLLQFASSASTAGAGHSITITSSGALVASAGKFNTVNGWVGSQKDHAGFEQRHCADGQQHGHVRRLHPGGRLRQPFVGGRGDGHLQRKHYAEHRRLQSRRRRRHALVDDSVDEHGRPISHVAHRWKWRRRHGRARQLR